MTKANQVDLPNPKMENDASDKIYNDILELFQKENLGWSGTVIDSVGDKFVKLLTLWHVTSHHMYFSERGAKLLCDLFK